jgi:hypothetical protein
MKNIQIKKREGQLPFFFYAYFRRDTSKFRRITSKFNLFQIFNSFKSSFCRQNFTTRKFPPPLVKFSGSCITASCKSQIFTELQPRPAVKFSRSWNIQKFFLFLGAGKVEKIPILYYNKRGNININILIPQFPTFFKFSRALKKEERAQWPAPYSL